MGRAGLGDGDRAGELFALLNPVNHARDPAAVARYKVEPYVVTADVYSVAPHAGRGGWTWYTGSAGWMDRAGIEGILGLTRRGDRLAFKPAFPRGWPGFEMTIRYGATRYRIVVENRSGFASHLSHAELDGQTLDIAPGDDF